MGTCENTYSFPDFVVDMRRFCVEWGRAETARNPGTAFPATVSGARKPDPSPGPGEETASSMREIRCGGRCGGDDKKSEPVRLTPRFYSLVVKTAGSIKRSFLQLCT